MMPSPRCRTAGIAVGVLLSASVSAEERLGPSVDRELPSLIAIYKTLHASPELSREEAQTSALLAKELRAAGYTVTENLGRYADPSWKGYGLVAVLENGAGPTVLVRTDLDALPVQEQTGLPYASTVRVKGALGADVPVMHACGHDLHMTSWLGTARALASMREQWKGRVMFVGQPAEERVEGARALLADRLYERFGTPDYLLALHDTPDVPVGSVGYTPGFALASSNLVQITVRGVGGHGSRPDRTRDPVVLASQLVLALQTIVSREVSPLDSAVLTVGSIHGGTRANIIGDEVRLQVTVRAYKTDVRDHVLSAIERIAKGLAIAANVPADRMPIVEIDPNEATPATYNTPELTERLAGVFRQALGSDLVVAAPPIMGSEDFGQFGLDGHRIPSVMFWLGGADPVAIEQATKEGLPPPGLHSGRWAPPPEPTIRAGVTAMTAAVLDLLGPK